MLTLAAGWSAPKKPAHPWLAVSADQHRAEPIEARLGAVQSQVAAN
jgi:hypothetical protein